MNEVEKITRDLLLQNFELDFPLGEEKIIEMLRQAIIQLLMHDLEKLWNILYRIDVNEKKVKVLFEGNKPEEIAPGIAQLIYDRLKEKAISRIKFRAGNINGE